MPCYNLYWGFKIGQELWRSSVHAGRDDIGSSLSPVVAVWWGAWVGSGMLNRASLAIGGVRPSLADLKMQMTIAMGAASLAIVAAVAGIMMIRAITRAQARLRHGEGAAPPTTF